MVAASESKLIFADDFVTTIELDEKNLASYQPDELTSLSKSFVTEKYTFGHYYEWRKQDRKYGDNIGCIALASAPQVIVQCENNFTDISYLKLAVILGTTFEKISWLNDGSNIANTLDISILSSEHIRQKQVVNEQWLSILKTIGGRHLTLGLCLTSADAKTVACLDLPKESVNEFDISFFNQDSILRVDGRIDDAPYQLFFDLASQQFVTHTPQPFAVTPAVEPTVKAPVAKSVAASSPAEPRGSNTPTQSVEVIPNHCLQIANFTEEKNAQVYANKLNRFHKNIGLHPKLIGEQQWYSVILVADDIDSLAVIREEVAAQLKLDKVGFNISCPQF